MPQTPNTHDLLLESILSRLEKLDTKMDRLSDDLHQTNIKYENLRNRAVKWSSLAAIGSIGLTQIPKILNWFGDSP